MDLGRPWRPYAAVAYIDCKLEAHIEPEGWDNWDRAENVKTAHYVEFGSTGPGGNGARRVSWSKQLSASEAATYTVAAILRGTDGWNPTRAGTETDSPGGE